jgi:hypothetical protein
MRALDPWSLLIKMVSEQLELDTKSVVNPTSTSRVDIIADYDFSGNPTKIGETANKIIVFPDTEVGANRGFADVESAIGYGPRTWVYHVVLELQVFPVRSTKVKTEVREMMAQLASRVMASLHTLQRTCNAQTEDSNWLVLRAASPYIQGSGVSIKDAGPSRSIKGEQRLVVGYILQYRG